MSIGSQQASGVFRLEKDGGGIKMLSNMVLADLVFAKGRLYGREVGGGYVYRVDTDSGALQQLGVDLDVDTLIVSPDGQLFALQNACTTGNERSVIVALDPDLATLTPVVKDAWISALALNNFAASADHLVWITEGHGQFDRVVHVSGIHGEEPRVLLDPKPGVSADEVLIAGDFAYVQCNLSVLDAHMVRVPLAGGAPECVARVGWAASAVDNSDFLFVDPVLGPPACLVRYDGSGRATFVATIAFEDGLIDSVLAVSGDYLYTVSLVDGGPAVLRIPGR